MSQSSRSRADNFVSRSNAGQHQPTPLQHDREQPAKTGLWSILESAASVVTGSLTSRAFGSGAATAATAPSAAAVEESTDDDVESEDEAERAPHDVVIQMAATHPASTPRPTNGVLQEAVVGNVSRPAETTQRTQEVSVISPSSLDGSQKQPTPRHAAGRVATGSITSRSSSHSELTAISSMYPEHLDKQRPNHQPLQRDTDRSHHVQQQQQQQHMNVQKNTLPPPNASQSSRKAKAGTEATTAHASKDRVNLGSMAARGQHW